MMSLAQFIVGGSLIGIFLASDIATIALLLCVVGACCAALSLNLYAIAQIFAGPRAAGTWVGIQNALGNTSGILQPVISGIIIDRAGYGGAFILAGVISALGGLWWMFGVPKIEQIDLD
jgi:MFS family permease